MVENMEQEEKQKKPVKVSYMCLGNLLGIMIGLTVGRMLFNNPGAGLCFFAGLGMMLGAIVDYKEKKRRATEEKDTLDTDK